MTPAPFHRTQAVTLYTGDALEVLTELPTDSVDTIVSSPPFYGLRDYGTARWHGGDAECTHSTGHDTTTAPSAADMAARDSAAPAHRGGLSLHCTHCGATRGDRQYGLESSLEEYIETLRAVFSEIRRVLTETGCVWLNLGDSYSSHPPGSSTHATRSSSLTHPDSTTPARESMHRAGLDRTRVLPRKNLLGIPWRVAFALQNDGWILRNAAIWSKTNPMPESVRDRLSTTYEFVFLLTQQPHYYFDLDAIRVPAVTHHKSARPTTPTASSRAQRRKHRRRAKDTAIHPVSGTQHGAAMRPGHAHTAMHPRGKNPGDVWRIATRPYPEAHFATFPVDLPHRCIAASTPPHGTVLDPFSGAGTTGLAALQLEHRYIGIELNESYNQLALTRLPPHTLYQH